ncbi:uncharacterized protein METZ01_LOCUS508842, partial [marine metagenome]
MKKVGIIGYGRFGKLLVDLLPDSKYEIKIYDSSDIFDDSIKLYSLDEVLQSLIVFIAVPISAFEDVVKEISQHNLYNTTIVDVCSVKVYPVEIMEKYLQKHIGIIASHPHFGPDSYSPFKELKITIYPIRDIYNRFDELKQVFESQSI